MSTAPASSSAPPQVRSPPATVKTEDQRPAKRKRRALSCTPCIKRKTRCSALGTVPCESCVKRGRPHECVWDNGDEPPIASPAATAGARESLTPSSWASANELAALRQEVETLKAMLDSHLASCRPLPQPLVTLPSLDRLPAAVSAGSLRSALPSSSGSLPTVSEMDRKVETAVAGLEELVTAGGAPLRPEAHSVYHNMAPSPATSSLALSAASPSTPAGAKSSPSSRLPAVLDSALRDDAHWDSIGAVVPPPETSRFLVDAYLASPYHKSWHILLGPVFLREHRAFCIDPSSLRLRGIDPGWVALYLMVIAFAIKSLTLDEVAHVWPHYDLQEVARLPRALYEASLLALRIGKCDSVPQVRHVQAALLYVTFLFHFGPASDGTAAMMQLGAATSTLQWLGLDRLGNDAKKLPKDDPALRDLHPVAAFELVKVLFHSASLLDGTMSKRFGVCRLAESTSAPSSTVLPSYWNDADLEANSLHGRSTSRWVDSSTARLGSLFATENRKFMKEVESGGQDATFEMVLRYETGLRGVLVQVPRPDLEPACLHFMQLTLVSSINNRLLRAHRPFMVRGYSDSRFAHSRAAALDSARSIIATQRLMMACPQYRPTFVNRWILGAAFVIAIDCALALDDGPGTPSPSFAGRRDDIVSALEMFRQPNPRDPTPDVTDQCARTVQAILETLSRWQEARAGDSKPVAGGTAGLGGFFQRVKDLLAQFTNASAAQEPAISSPQLASIQNPAPLPPDFDWSLLVNSGAFPDGMSLDQATAYTTRAAWAFRLD